MMVQNQQNVYMCVCECEDSDKATDQLRNLCTLPLSHWATC